MVKLRPDWIANLHLLRGREIERIFSNCPRKYFGSGLEIGAGDCFQSGLLSEYVERLTVTEYSEEWLKDKKDSGRITHMACDAEKIGGYFPEKTFDLVYSSNVLEHLPRPELALEGIRKILKDDGITVHSVPNRLWKFSHLLLFYPHLLLYAVEKALEPGYLSRKIMRPAKPEQKTGPAAELPNNPKTERPFKIFSPMPHGVSATHWEEFRNFGKKRWLDKFRKAGFDVLKVEKGELSSPFGFGWNALRKLLSGLGLASEYIFIAKKAGSESRFTECFK
jgi:SAM-dependent methyltransferase